MKALQWMERNERNIIKIDGEAWMNEKKNEQRGTNK